MATLISTEPLALDLPVDAPADIRSGTAAIVVPMTHPLAAQLREYESRFFEEAPLLFGVPEAEDLFMFLVITHDGAARHVVRHGLAQIGRAHV